MLTTNASGYAKLMVTGGTSQKIDLVTDPVDHCPVSMSNLYPGDIFWYNNSYYMVEDKTERSLICIRNKIGTRHYFDRVAAIGLTVLQAYPNQKLNWNH